MKNKLLIVLLILCFIITGCSNNKLNKDYYTYINEKELENYKLSSDEFSVSKMENMQEKVNDEVDELLKIELEKSPQMNILYNQLLDMDARNKNGLDVLNKYINLIDSSNNIDEFIKNSVVIEDELSVPIFTLAQVLNDFKNTNEKMIYLNQMTGDFGVSLEYYINDDYLSTRALVKQYGIKLLKLYGYDSKKAREISKDITEYYTNLAKKSRPTNYFNNVENLYNIVTKEELVKIYDKLDKSYFDFIPENTKINLLDKDNYQAINESLTNENLNVLKEIVKLKILENYCDYLNIEYLELTNDMENEMLGVNKKLDINKLAKNEVISAFQYDFDKLYTEKNLSIETKNSILSMINDISAYYERNINNINWLDKETKESAISKLKNMKVNIGEYNNYPNYSKSYQISKNKTLLENIISMNKEKSKYELNKLSTDQTIPSVVVSQTVVNAYYSAQDNSINFLTAFVNFYDKDLSYFENLGSVGMIIAHEITHAFDLNGSKFDANGNLNNWWTDKDSKNFEKLKEKVIKYYDKYEVISGNYINGELTVNENIADLGAVSCISNIAIEKSATKEEIKEMYKSFASLWIMNETEEYQKMLLLIDTHSPNKYRVNATLASTDLFYEVYDIAKTNSMYVNKDDRVKIW